MNKPPERSRLSMGKGIVVPVLPEHGEPKYPVKTLVCKRGTVFVGAIYKAYRTVRNQWEYVVSWDLNIDGALGLRRHDWRDDDLEALPAREDLH
jgi:hypothetical protein